MCDSSELRGQHAFTCLSSFLCGWLYDVKDRVNGPDDPLRPFVRGQPSIFIVQALRVPRFEKTENVADELGADSALCAKTGCTDDRAKRTAEISLLAFATRERGEHGAVCLDDECYKKDRMNE